MSWPRMLAISGVLGLVTGVVLERSRGADDEGSLGPAPIVEQAMPTGSPLAIDQMQPDPRSLEGIAPFPNASPRRMFGGTTAENGLGAVSWFETPASVDEVLGFYEEAWKTEHPLFTSHRFSERRGYVAFFEHHFGDDGIANPDEGVLHMVSVSDEGGRTMVFLSATEPEHFFGDRELPGGVRVPEGLRPQVVRTGEVGQERATVFASSRALTPDALEAAEQHLLTQDGWELLDRAVSPAGRTTLVARRGAFVQTIIVDAKTPHESSVLISVEQRNP